MICFYFNTSNAELNPICHLLALLGAHHILHVSTIRVKPPLSCFHVIFPGFRSLIYAIGKMNDNEISLNFRLIYPILYLFVNIYLLDALNCIISLFQASTYFEHICSKHVEALNKLIIKFSASSWLILINKYIEMHGQQNIKVVLYDSHYFIHDSRCIFSSVIYLVT